METWYVADPFKPDQKPSEQFYPRPGKKNVAVRLGIVPVEGGETVWVEWDRKKYEYMAAVRWDRVRADHDSGAGPQATEVALLSADAKTGKTKQLLEEKDAAWVNLTPECRSSAAPAASSGSAATRRARPRSKFRR